MRPSGPNYLPPEADYGRLPFDHFVLEKWDYSQPVEQDQQQWDNLAREYLALDARGRQPYHAASFERQNVEADSPLLPTADQIARVLVPHQTLGERYAGTSPAFLRTCYAPELTEAYKELLNSVLATNDVSGGLRENSDLNDAALYADLDHDWTKILLRAPYIVDAEQSTELDDYGPHFPVDWKWEYAKEIKSMEDFQKPFFEANLKTVTLVCLIDEEALRKKLIKLMFLDVHGNCVWDNKMNAETFNIFIVCGYLLQEYVDGRQPDAYRRGALLET